MYTELSHPPKESPSIHAVSSEPTLQTRFVDGRVWDLLPPGTFPRSGDEIEDEGVWRPRALIADFKTRYDRAVFARCAAQALYDASPSDETNEALQQAWARQHEALAASDDDTVQERDRIDSWRAGEGRETFNADRRNVRSIPNANLSRMSDEEKATHKREQARLRKQRSRAALAA